MTSLGAGGGRRTASLGSGSSRTGTLVAGTTARSKTLPSPIYDAVGTSDGVALVNGVGDIDPTGDDLLQENGDRLLQEDNKRILLEDAISAGSSAGVATVAGVGAALRDSSGTIAGVATVSGVMEVPGAADNLLKEDGDDLLLESGDFILLDDGTVLPPNALTYADGAVTYSDEIVTYGS